MRNLKRIGALTLALSLALGTTVMAAPSPKSSVIWALLNTKQSVENVSAEDSSSSSSSSNSSNSSTSASSSVSSADVKSDGVPVITETAGPLALATLSNSILADAQKLGLTPVVKAVKNVIAPTGYVKGKPITLTWAVAGVKDGSQLFAYYLKDNGTIAIAPVSVKGGYATFTIDSLNAVSLVEYTQAPTTTATGLH